MLSLFHSFCLRQFCLPLHQGWGNGLGILSPEKISGEEASAYKTSKSKVTPKSGKQSGVDTRNMPPDLAEIVAAWSELTDAIRRAIVAIVRDSRGR